MSHESMMDHPILYRLNPQTKHIIKYLSCSIFSKKNLQLSLFKENNWGIEKA